MRVYLDNNATTPMAPEVLDAMMPYLGDDFGNPSSFHTFGSSVMPAVDRARDSVARLIGAPDPSCVTFTSGGTESDNWALRGSLLLDRGRRRIVTSSVEHPAVLETARELEKEGYALSVVGVHENGLLDMEQLSESVEPDTAVVSVMAANNETGVLMPLAGISAAARAAGALFHTDAVQAVGKIAMDVEREGVDLLSLSGHKLHGPKGVGALYVRRGISLPPLILGGHQEHGRRAGTYNVPGIIGLGCAAEMAIEGMARETASITALREKLEKGILESCPGAIVVGEGAPRLPNTVNMLFRGVESEAILTILDMHGVSASSGSACSTGSKDPSHVLMAMNVDRNCANSAIRFSLGRYNTTSDIDYVLDVLPRIIAKLRSISPYV